MAAVLEGPVDPAPYRAALRALFPALGADQVAFLDEGWGSRVFLVDDAWIFRFPKHEGAARKVAAEAAVLRWLAPRLPVAVPEVRWLHPGGGAWPDPFLGYPCIPGVPLPAPGTDSQADQLGAALGVLHSLDPGEVPPEGLTCPDLATHRARHRWLRGRAVEAAPRYLSDELVAASDSWWERLFASLEADGVTGSLLHFDLWPSHVLADPDADQVTGILDWEDLGVGDPAVDLAALWLSHPEAFVARVAEAAGYPWTAGFRERVEFLADLCAWFELVHGDEIGDQGLAAKGAATIRGRLGGTRPG